MKFHFSAYILLTALFFSCGNNQHDNIVREKIKSKTLPKNKPSSTFSDTLTINDVAAVFYTPDSIQLDKIRSVTDSGAFQAIMHEYDYLSRTAFSILKKDFPNIKIIEAKNVRYILFTTSDKKQICIDLDKNYDPYGLYIFNLQNPPQLVDMANTESSLGFYFYK